MSWREAILEVGAEETEALAEALLEAGAMAVGLEDADAGTSQETPQFGEPDGAAMPLWRRCRVVALFAPVADLHERLRHAQEAAGLPPEKSWGIREVAEQDWVRATQSQFSPIAIGDRLWIVPSWHTPPEPTAINLVLDPGLAFGTGSHPTTRLCLHWLLDAVRPGASVLDYGAGSGILAIAAKKLGAGLTVGVDIDDRALAAAQENARRNGVAIEWRHSSAPLPERFDLVVANILTNPLKLLAPLLATRLAPGGRLALAGVLESQASEVIAAYAPYLALAVGACEDGWVRLEGRRE